jgi:outer membrane protein assembly factor BamB
MGALPAHAADEAVSFTPPLTAEQRLLDFSVQALLPDGVAIGVGARGQRVEAVDLQSNQRRWSGEIRPGQIGWVSAAEGAVVEVVDGQMFGLDAATGRERWRVWAPDYRLTYGTRPVIQDGVVFVGARTSDGAIGGAYSTVLAYRLADGTPLWQGPRWLPDEGKLQPELLEGAGRDFLRRGLEVQALDAGNGSLLWSSQVGQAAGAALTLVDGHLFAVSKPTGDQTVEVTSMDGLAGRVAWRQTLPADTRLPRLGPVAAGGRLYVALGGRLYVLGQEKGDVQWSIGLEAIAPVARLASISREHGAPVVAGSTVFLADGEYLAAVDAASGRVLWRSDPGISGPVKLSDRGLLVSKSTSPGPRTDMVIMRTAGPIDESQPPTTPRDWLSRSMEQHARGLDAAARDSVAAAFRLDPASVLDDEVLLPYFGKVDLTGPLLPRTAGRLQRAEIEYTWVGFAPQSWIQLTYQVDRDNENAHLRGQGYRRGRTGPEPLRSVDRSLSSEALDRLAAGLRNFVPTPRTFGVITHRDDYPRVEARLEFEGGQRVLLSSSSNTVGMIPWHAELNGKMYVQYSAQTAIDLLHLLHEAAPETWNEVPPAEVGASSVDRRWNRPTIQ